MSTGFEEIEEILDPSIPVPADVEPQLSDMLPRGYLSVSQVGLVLKCPHAWYLRYVEEKSQTLSVRPFQGIQVHKAVEKLLGEKLRTGVLPPVELAQDTFSDAFEDKKKHITDWEEGGEKQVKDTGHECIKHYYNEAAQDATPVIVEKTFHTYITTQDGKVKLPVLGRIDSLQVQTFNEKEYQDVREGVVADYDKQLIKNPDKPLVVPPVKKPLRLHDLKVVTDKWSESDLENDIQFAIYAGVEHIPDVQVDQLVKGRAKVPRPRYERLTGIITDRQVQHAVDVVAGVAKTIGMGNLQGNYTDPGSWWCSSKWCSMWIHCRGKTK